MKDAAIRWIREVMAATGWHPTELARKSGLAPSTLTRVLGGQPPKRKTLRSIAGASGISVPEDLLPAEPPELESNNTTRAEALGWLTHGAELAYDLKGDVANHGDVIWALLQEAVETIDKTPDNERRWLTSGNRSGGWNMIGMTKEDLAEIEQIRLLSAMKPYDGATKYAPQRNDVDRALGILDWMRWCNSARLPDRLTKAAIALARGGDQELVHKLYCPTRLANRQNVTEIRTRTIGYIMTGLKNCHGIVPAAGLTFRENNSIFDVA